MNDRHRAAEQEFERIALPHLESVYRAAVALCGSVSEAEDLTQTTFLKALRRFDTFDGGTDGKGWLMRILRNTWIDRLRHKSVVGAEVALDESRVAGGPEREETVWTNARDLLENFSDEAIIRALGELNDDQRLTLFLVDVERMSVEEAAAVLEVAPGTIKSRSSRARLILRQKLADHARDLGFVRREK